MPARQRSLVVLILATASLLAVVRPASAHPVPFSYIDLHVGSRSIDGTLVVHVFDAAHDLGIEPPERLLDPAVAQAASAVLVALLAPRLQLWADGEPLPAAWSAVEPLAGRQSLRLHVAYALTRTPGVVVVGAALFPYDPTHRTFVNVYEGDALTQAILDAGAPRFEYYSGTRAGVLATVAKFLPAGVRHILIGPDHLLFLVGLLLLGGTLAQLARLVTAFTVAHSITLSLAALNLINAPARLVEPAIALSIVYVGVDNLLVRDGRDVRAWIAFAFGFVHGFGFAGVLREMDLPARALGWSLFSFNAGVEIGQLLVVAVVAGALAALHARRPAAGRRLAVAGSAAVIVAGTFWFVQRLFSAGGLS